MEPQKYWTSERCQTRSATDQSGQDGTLSVRLADATALPNLSDSVRMAATKSITPRHYRLSRAEVSRLQNPNEQIRDRSGQCQHRQADRSRDSQGRSPVALVRFRCKQAEGRCEKAKPAYQRSERPCV